MMYVSNLYFTAWSFCCDWWAFSWTGLWGSGMIRRWRTPLRPSKLPRCITTRWITHACSWTCLFFSLQDSVSIFENCSTNAELSGHHQEPEQGQENYTRGWLWLLIQDPKNDLSKQSQQTQWPICNFWNLWKEYAYVPVIWKYTRHEEIYIFKLLHRHVGLYAAFMWSSRQE